MNSPYGDSIEDYEVQGMLGKGGFAQVFKAKSKKNGCEVAIKRIDRKKMQARKLTSRVKNEIKVHFQVDHPSVLDLYNFFEDSDYVYLVLELCHNGALNKYLSERQKRLTEAEARKIFRQVVEGLLYLHSYMILHRDLSLSNILLTKTMDAKIADFGLSIQLKAEDEKHYTMCGTPNFIAPEIAVKGPHGLECDVWSLGCMLYTLLVGQPPFDTDDVMNTLDRVVCDSFKLPCDLSPEAQDLISSLLIKSPTERLKLSEILSHPFMAFRAQQSTQETREQLSSSYHHRRQNMGVRGGLIAVPSSSVGSLDSGQYTMFSSSNNAPSSSASSSAGGPMRATARPRGAATTTTELTLQSQPLQHVAATMPSFHSVSVSSDRRSSRHPSPLPPSEQQLDRGQGVGCRRAKSMDVLDDLGGGGGEGRKEAWSYHSQPPLTTVSARQRRERNKENLLIPPSSSSSASKVAITVQQQRERRPFQDSTNRQQQGIPYHQPVKKPLAAVNADNAATRGVEKSQQQRSSSSLKELVPPLNVARLPPGQEELRNGMLCISKDSKVWHKHFGRSSRHLNDSRLSRTGTTDFVEILQVSTNGMEVEIFRPLHSSRSQHSGSAEHEGFYLHACYTYHDLPSRYWKRYQYVAEFVGVVRSKTPKVTLYTDRAKCTLMENGPNPDYQVYFYDGSKVRHKLVSSEWSVELQGGCKHYVKDDSGGEEISRDLLPLYEHARESLHKCRDIELAMTGLETQLAGSTYFPVVAGRKRRLVERRSHPPPPSSSPSPSSSASNTNVATASHLGATSSQSPSLLQFPDTKMPSYPGTPADVSFQNSTVGSIKGHSRTGGGGGGNRSRSGSLPLPSGHSSERKSVSEGTVIRTVQVTDTCKAVLFASGAVVLHYSDGSHLEVQPSSEAFKYTDAQGREFTFAIGQSNKMPEDLKPKLIPLHKAMNCFVSSSQSK